MIHRRYLLILLVTYFCAFTTSAQKYDTTYIKNLLQKATSLQSYDLDSCDLLAKQALQLSVSSNYQKGIRSACVRIGSVWMAKGRNDSSFHYLYKAFDISYNSHDNEGLTGIAILLGYAHLYQGGSDSAFYYFYEGLKYGRRSNSPELNTQIYNSLGNLFSEYKDYSKSLSYYRIGLFLANKNKQVTEQITALMGIGGNYYLLKKYPQALKYFLMADSVSRTIDITIALYQNLNNLALCYAEIHDEKNALKYYHQARLFYQTNGMQSDEANLYYNMACLFSNTSNKDSAYYYLIRAIRTAEMINEFNRVAECRKLLSELYAGKGEYHKAYNTLVTYIDLSDSLLNTEKVKSISEMQTKYETNLKERKIEVLNLQNQSRTRERNFLLTGLVVLFLFSSLLFWQRNVVKKEKNRSDTLLLNILPLEVADELKKYGKSKAKQYSNVTVMFADFVDFTTLSEQLSPTELVEEINRNFVAFDHIMDKYGIEKIKTIGDAYLAVCGLPNEFPDHAERMIHAAIELQEFIKKENSLFRLRVGINSGPVVAGIVGTRKFAYDIWGDTVNTANRMESIGAPTKINISQSTYMLSRDKFIFQYRGKVNAKGKGEVDAYFVEGIKI